MFIEERRVAVIKYLTPTNLYEQAQARWKELNKACQTIEKRMEKYPEGKIHIVSGHNKIQYYLRIDPKDKSGEYISKKDVERIRIYLRKKYDEEVLASITKEKSNLEHFLKKTNSSNTSIQNLYSNYPEEIKKYMIPIDVSDADYAAKWSREPYQSKEIGRDVPTFITNKGEHVRSKSELMIANALERYGVPYKYECPFILSNGQIIHPDFTVLDVSHRKEIYWEHRGMMDDKDYAVKAVQRIKMLEKEGVLLGDNLIITEETKGLPLGTNEVERIVKRWKP